MHPHPMAERARGGPRLRMQSATGAAAPLTRSTGDLAVRQVTSLSGAHITIEALNWRKSVTRITGHEAFPRAPQLPARFSATDVCGRNRGRLENVLTIVDTSGARAKSIQRAQPRLPNV